MTCCCRITLKVDRFNKLIAFTCIIIVLMPRKLEMSNFCSTTIRAFIMTKLSSDLTVEIRRTWGDSRMKEPCRITGSSEQEFDFVSKLQKHWPQRRDSKLVGWPIAKTATRRWYFFLNFQLWTQILRSVIDH